MVSGFVRGQAASQKLLSVRVSLNWVIKQLKRKIEAIRFRVHLTPDADRKKSLEARCKSTRSLKMVYGLIRGYAAIPIAASQQGLGPQVA